MNKFEIENLELFYGDFKALKNINMNISANEITAFIGPSGCGKSTLLKTLDRMNDLVDSCKINGSVKYDGKDIYSYDINELRKNVAMVFQKPNPFAVGQLFLIHHQLAETLLFPQVVYRLRHHYPCHPGTQCTFATEGEVGENFDEAIVQYVMGRIDIARIAVTYRQHLLGVEGV